MEGHLQRLEVTAKNAEGEKCCSATSAKEEYDSSDDSVESIYERHVTLVLYSTTAHTPASSRDALM